MTFLMLPAIAVCCVAFGMFMTIATILAKDELQSTTVNPFAGTVPSATSADTMSSSNEMVKTVFAPKTDWITKQFSSLTQVEDMLDYLDAHHVEIKEVVILDENNFTVRWKS